jgi:hypothetical protein
MKNRSEGFSDDKKFLLVSKQGNRLLLRTSDISKHVRSDAYED